MERRGVKLNLYNGVRGAPFSGETSGKCTEHTSRDVTVLQRHNSSSATRA